MQDAWKSIRQVQKPEAASAYSALSKSDMSIQCSHKDKPPDTPTHVDVVQVQDDIAIVDWIYDTRQKCTGLRACVSHG